MDLLFTGRWMDAEEARRWGLVNEVVPMDDLLERAHKMAQTLAAGPPLVFAAIKEVVRETEQSPFVDALRKVNRRELRTVDVLYSSEDQKEGALAFAEKREPVWQGR